MADSTPQQRIEWLQNGLREIGQLCLQLSGNGADTAVSNSSPQSHPQQTSLSESPSRENGDGATSGATGISLSQFLEGVQDLSPEERVVIVEAAMAMLSQVFVHLPLKRAMHGIDPTQRLRLLHERLKAQIRNNEASDDDRGFHDEMIEIFHSLRDLHTNYVLPSAYHGKTAFLPFTIEEYFEGPTRKRQFIVTRVLGAVPASFQPGVTVTHWNGIPIARAIQLNAAREAGSNVDARHARGLEALTLRPMALTAPPDETWVIIDYLVDNQPHQAKFHWRVTMPEPSAMGAEADDPLANGGEVAKVLGFSAETEATRRARKSLFHPAAMNKEHRMARTMAQVRGSESSAATSMDALAGTVNLETLGSSEKGDALRGFKRSFKRFADVDEAQQTLAGVASAAASQAIAADDPQTNSLMPDFFGFRKVTTPSGEFGYIRIYSFMALDANAFVAEFVRMASLLPDRGLIIDLRGNGGGNIRAGEQLLQVLTPQEIEPERFHFINTAITLQLCRKDDSLEPWIESIELAVQTGEIYSQGFPITSPEAANSLGQKYRGKVLLITDALCYSTTDIFAAGFQDHGIGQILGVSGRTGAGGANVWTYNFFAGLPGFNSPLPKGVSFRTAIRRSTRVKDKAGVPLEDLGVKPDDLHHLTRRDILEDSCDLISKAASMLV